MTHLRRLVPLCLVSGAIFIQLLNVSSAAKDQNEVTVNTRDELIKAVQNAGPGTTILIAPGTYRGGLSFTELKGAKEKPVVLAALDEQNPPVFEGGASGLHLRRPIYVELRNLIISKATGNGLNIDDGGDANNPARQIVLRQLQVREIGPLGNRDGIKLSGVDQFTVDDCTIERWGDGGSAIDMVGCHDGQVSNCEFKYRGDLQANGVQTKGGSSEITIKHCRFENAGGRAVNIGGSTGRDYFRPPMANYEAKNITVEDCTFIGSMSPIVFVGVDGAAVRYNTIYRPTRWIIRILQESQGAEFVACRNGTFSNNLIAFRSDETRTIVNIGGGTKPETFKFPNNFWYCIDNPERSNRLSLPVEEANGTYGQDPEFINAGESDLRLKSTTPVRDAGVRSQTER